ncbi:wax ester/triacylglycerol synthase domain-containing protein [Actinopolymorpha rutila]|uniref:UDP-N-acetylglucosamine:LPS N-acetylglucosamine transferase n=1 Tax=Actinopolymorpha rutila TaxID=446787 RepID=A0A852ZIB2_9ACTN|nr:wax ester/triacylglycerol synthase domain-containing protein [Actinopolymorpha rutila]NYH91382.1 UDP-N-acetylglucosamine:LPS N-acetylglucosamine transferase [Actinopolymorpha rutila]
MSHPPARSNGRAHIGARISDQFGAQVGAQIGEGPHRVLLVSADMGGGHNSTANALEEAVRRLWPGSECHRVDTLDVMGPGVGRAFRSIYVSNVERTPWLYEFFYASEWRHRWFAQASKRFTGSWAGRRLRTEIDRFEPDLVLSTYPLGSSGLAWLRRHRGLGVRTACYVSDFAPHPFWVYPELDANFVVHETAVALARSAEPEVNVEVCAPPVVRAFAPGDQAQARRWLDLPADAFVVLLSCGAYSFGDADATVTALLDTSDKVCVVVACGRNEQTRVRLERLGLPRERLLPLGWTDQMPTLMRAADLLVTNAGGATALEGMASALPVVTTTPIAAHGVANANLMVVAGLTDLCPDLAMLQAYVRSVAENQEPLRRLRAATMRHLERYDLDSGLRALAAPRHTPTPASTSTRQAALAERPWPMRPADAFFALAETGPYAQELGAVLELGPLPGGRAVTVADVRRTMQARTSGLPPMRRVLVRRPLGWRLLDSVDAWSHVEEQRLTGHAGEEVTAAISDFWSRTIPAEAPAWRGLHVDGQAGGRSTFAVKLHHAQGDGISALGLLDRLLDPMPGDRLSERRPAARRHTARAGAVQVLRGVGQLAGKGLAPRHPLNQTRPTGQRDLVTVAVPWKRIRDLATACDAQPHEAILALVADALDRLLRPAGLLAPGRPLRAMFPVAMRPPKLDRISGNWTGALAVDLPTGPLELTQRTARIRAGTRLHDRQGEVAASAMVMWAAGQLPRPLHRTFARATYNRNFFNTIVSYMPGARGSRTFAGADVRAVCPVLPLTSGVPLTVGVVGSGAVAGVGVLLDRGLGLDRGVVKDAFRTSFMADTETPREPSVAVGAAG